MTRDGYSGVSLPDNLMSVVKNIVDEPENGFTSNADFIKEAIREKVAKYKKEKD